MTACFGVGAPSSRPRCPGLPVPCVSSHPTQTVAASRARPATKPPKRRGRPFTPGSTPGPCSTLIREALGRLCVVSGSRSLETQPFDRRLAHLELLDLAGDRHRKLVDENDMARHLVVRQ